MYSLYGVMDERLVSRIFRRRNASRKSDILHLIRCIIYMCIIYKGHSRYYIIGASSHKSVLIFIFSLKYICVCVVLTRRDYPMYLYRRVYMHTHTHAATNEKEFISLETRVRRPSLKCENVLWRQHFSRHS